MRKIYSMFMMAAMMFAALSLNACSSNDDEDDDNGGGNGKKTLKVDGESYYCSDVSSVEQTQRNGMYLEVIAVTDMRFQTKGHRLVMHISPSRVAQLEVGQEFGDYKISVRDFVHLNEINVNTYMWEVISGSFVIKSITDIEMTIQFNEMVIKHKHSGVERTIEGTAVLNSGTYKDGKLLPFSESINSLPDWLEDVY